MVFDVSVAMTWILFLALFPISFFWMRRAWRIFVKRDFSEVGLKRGVAPANPEKFAPYTGALNLVCGAITVCTILGVLTGSLGYETWSAIGGSTIWIKFFLDFIISRHAHPVKWGKKKKDDEAVSEKAGSDAAGGVGESN